MGLRFALFPISLLASAVTLLGACGRERDGSQFAAKGSSANGRQLLSVEQVARYRQLMPSSAATELAAILQDERLIWYDKTAIVPGYQDSMGDPEGMRPNTLRKDLINTAVPGGHERIFARRGLFQFPFGTGGIDESTNASGFNFWLPPMENGKEWPVAYWRLPWSRWRWVFPTGTVLGEVLTVNSPDGRQVVFEIRTRTRLENTWANDIYRPFRTAAELAAAIQRLRPQWASNTKLKTLVQHLQRHDNLKPASLVGRSVFASAFPQVDGFEDVLPDFGDPQLVIDLLQTMEFRSVKGQVWKQSGSQITYAPTTNQSFGVTANNYQAGLFPTDDEFCARCHKDAGRAFIDYYGDVAAYGELWGEDQAFSWHLFETANFVDPRGEVRNFNEDNRSLRSDMRDAGLVVPFQQGVHPEGRYRQLPQDWKYRPF